MFREEFYHFFTSALHFWIKHYTNFLSVLSYLVVATAPWQHCNLWSPHPGDKSTEYVAHSCTHRSGREANRFKKDTTDGV
jgi:hypothetical protein